MYRLTVYVKIIAIFKKLILLHLLYITFIIRHIYFLECSSKVARLQFYSSHLFLNRPFRIYLSSIYFYLYSRYSLRRFNLSYMIDTRPLALWLDCDLLSNEPGRVYGWCDLWALVLQH